MIKPLLQDDAFLADVRSARSDAGALHLWWLGQSGFLVLWGGRHLLFDPYLSDSLTRKYAATDKPHVRMTERVVTPERLDFCDVVTSSHNHTDHLDPDTLRPLLRANPNLRVVCPRANLRMVSDRSGVEDESLVDLDPEAEPTSARLGGFELTAIPAAHEAFDRNEAGQLPYVGYVVRCGPWKLYHSGDTLRYPGMERWLRPHQVDVALLPINGRAPERRVAGNLDGPEAAQLARDIGAGLAVPCHFEMFEFNTASPDRFVTACRELGQPCRVLRVGERLTLSGR